MSENNAEHLVLSALFTEIITSHLGELADDVGKAYMLSQAMGLQRLTKSLFLFGIDCGYEPVAIRVEEAMQRIATRGLKSMLDVAGDKVNWNFRVVRNGTEISIEQRATLK